MMPLSLSFVRLLRMLIRDGHPGAPLQQAIEQPALHVFPDRGVSGIFANIEVTSEKVV